MSELEWEDRRICTRLKYCLEAVPEVWKDKSCKVSAEVPAVFLLYRSLAQFEKCELYCSRRTRHEEADRGWTIDDEMSLREQAVWRE